MRCGHKPVPVNESVECQAVSPAGGEVVNVDLRVSGTKNRKQHTNKDAYHAQIN